MSELITKEQRHLLSLLCKAITGQQGACEGKTQAVSEDEPSAKEANRQVICAAETLNEQEWNTLFAQAQLHKVVSLLYDVLMEQELPNRFRSSIQKITQSVVSTNYKLLFTAKHVLQVLVAGGVEVIVLKGASVSPLYPVWEYRKSGDVDLLLTHPEQMEMAERLLTDGGFSKVEDQHAQYHVAFCSPDGIEIEVHAALTEEFDSASANRAIAAYTAQCGQHCERTELLGVNLPVLSGAYQAYALLLHMLHHFLRSGFGLRLLCDWVVFWNKGQSDEVKQEYNEMIRRTGVEGFSGYVTAVCVECLGLDADRAKGLHVAKGDTQQFLKDIFDSMELGESSTERMVALKGTGLRYYVSEFHHQMHLNYPKAGKCFLLWPFLWVATLVRFVSNNRKLHRGSAFKIIRNAGGRGKILSDMRLFSKK